MYLGIDGGGTKTAALLVDRDGRLVGQGVAGGSNHHTVGLDAAYASVRQAVGAALAGRAPEAACFCMAGADQPHDFQQLRSKLGELDLGCPSTVRNDLIGVLRAGSRSPVGVAVVCGTGFNAGGIGMGGEEYRLPALGPISGDVAGARRLATRALGAAFRSWDGRGEATLLADAILHALDAPDFETIAARWAEGKLTDEQIKSLAPLVFEVSEAGDRLAQQFIREQGTEIGIAANAVLRRLNLGETDCDVILGGSLFYGKGPLLMQTVDAIVHGFAPRVVICRLEVPPVVGAVLLAAASTGKALDPGFAAALPEALRVPPLF